MAVLTGSLSRLAGGTFSSIRRPMQEMLRQFPVEMGVFGVEDRFSAADLPSWEPIRPSVFPGRGPRAFGWAPGMLPAVRDFRPELLQVHGIWMHYSVVSSALARRLRVPHIVHLHGMLDSWAVGRSHWKKRLAARLFEDRHLRTASCLRALCEPELRAIRQYGLKGRVCVIPNGIDLPAAGDAGPPPWKTQVEPGKKVLLFVSRIHVKKGLPNLIRAWARLQRSEPSFREWALVIAGWDTTGHEAELGRLVAELQVSESVKLVGPLFDEAKDQAFRNAAAFVLPSHSEGLPMTILEAWSYSLPVVMTPQCNLPEGFAAGAAIPVDPEPLAIEKGLRDLVGMSEAERAAMGMRGLRLVRERFQWNAIARQMHAVNLWILGGGAAPDCLV